MKTSSNYPADTNSLREPLLVTAVPLDNSPKIENDSTKTKSDPLNVHRLLSFLFGSLVGISLQLISVVVFAKLLLHAQHRQENEQMTSMPRGAGDAITTAETPEEEAMNRYETLMKSEDTTWFNVAIWIVYHASLGVYLIVWVAMMTLAMSRVGWRCISSGLHIPTKVTRRTCFLRTFFFINGFVQGSLMPWIILELYVGTASFDVIWMPVVHLGVFLAVVFIYDWMKDELGSSTKTMGIVGEGDNEDDNESNSLV